MVSYVMQMNTPKVNIESYVYCLITITGLVTIKKPPAPTIYSRLFFWGVL